MAKYRVPDPFDTLEACARYTHQDVPNMSRQQLLIERARVGFALGLCDEKRYPARAEWLAERLEAVTMALAGSDDPLRPRGRGGRA